MLSTYLAVPFPRNESVSLLKRQTCILHGHHKYCDRFKNALYVFRDGRDVMVSAYYYFLVPNERNAEWAIEHKRALKKKLAIEDVSDVQGNLPKLIRHLFTTYSRGMFRFSWSEFVDSVVGRDAHIIKYEDLLDDRANTLAGGLRTITGEEPDMEKVRKVCDEFSFENQAGRKPGVENTSSFLRKGVAGDWKNKFTRAAAEVFHSYAGKQLIAAGYEKNDKWVQSCS